MSAINRNVLVAPHFPDGEIVNGFLVRLLNYGGPHTLSLACRRLLNRRPGLEGMPSSLGRFHEEIGHLYGDVDWLIDKHTEYNFYCCGLPKDKFEDQRNRLLGMMKGPVRLCRLPLLFTPAENCFMQCPECAIWQKNEFGFEFCHRRTRAPFVNVCSIHGVLLRSSRPQMRLFDERCQGEPNRNQVRKTMELGKRIEHCVEVPANTSQYQKEDVIAHLIKAGWMVDRKRVHLSNLLERFSLYFKDSFADERLELMCQTSSYLERALRSLVRWDRAVHPEWCVLLKWFADENDYGCRRPLREQKAPLSTTDVTATRRNEPSRETILAALATGENLAKVAQTMGISRDLMRALCKRYAVDVAWRPKLIAPELAADIRKVFLVGGLPKDVAKAFNISLSSAYRQLAIWDEVEVPSKRELAKRIEADKAEWLLHRAENEGLSRSSLRNKRMALWMRLHRNVPSWLQANLPPPLPPKHGKSGAPARTLVRALNEVLSDVSDECKHQGKKRIHVSEYRLQAASGVSDYALKALITNGGVTDLSEPRSTFVSDRVKLAVARGWGRPIEKKFATIAKEAGVRTETVRRALKK